MGLPTPLASVGLQPRMDEAYQAELADLPPKLSQKARLRAATN